MVSAVENLNNLEAIVPAVQDLGRRHAGYGVQDQHYDSVASALRWTLIPAPFAISRQTRRATIPETTLL